jgi:hypothetical protein
MTNINDRLNRLAKISNTKENNNINLIDIINFGEKIQDNYRSLNVPKTSYQNLTSLILRIKEINKHEF